MGMGGRAPVGGSARGREATGRDMMRDTVVWSAACNYQRYISWQYSGAELRLSERFMRGSSVLIDLQWEASRKERMLAGALLLKQMTFFERTNPRGAVAQVAED